MFLYVVFFYEFYVCEIIVKTFWFPFGFLYPSFHSAPCAKLSTTWSAPHIDPQGRAKTAEDIERDEFNKKVESSQP